MARKLFLHTILCGLLLLHASVLVASTSDPIANLLDKDAGLVLLVPNPSRLVEELKENPVVRAWNSEDVSWAFGFTREWLKIDRWEKIARTEIGYPLEDLLAAFTRPAALILWSDEGSAPWDFKGFGILAEVDDRTEPVEALLDYQLATPLLGKGSGAPFETAKEDYLGTTLHYRKPAADDEESAGDLGWARVGDRVAVARPLDQLKRMVAALVEGGDAPSSGAHESLAQLQSRYPEADAYLQIDGDRLTQYILTGVKIAFTGHAASGDGAAAAASSLSSDVLQALRLDTVQAFSVALRLDTSATDVNFDLAFSEEAGALKLLAYGPGPLRLPAFLPDNLTDLEVVQMSLGNAWGALQELSAGSQTLTLVTSQLTTGLKSASEDAGIDLERVILDGIGDQFFYGTFPIQPEEADAEPTQGVFLGIELKDEQSVTQALDALAETFGYGGQFETRDYMDTRIQVARTPTAAGGRLSYAVTDGHLLASTDLGTLQEAITRLRRPKQHEPIWDKPEIKSAIAGLPEGASALGITDPVSLLTELFTTLHDSQRRYESHKGGVCKPRLHLKREDVAGYLDAVISATYKEPGHYRSLMRLIAAESLRDER